MSINFPRQAIRLRVLIRILLVCWASPNSLIGLCVGLAGILSGGKLRLSHGCLEFYGGLVERGLRRLGVAGMTLGHTILGQTSEGLNFVRDHEHVHVRQYERWGPLFLPAYLGWSAWLWLKGKDCYRLNPFEIEAYAQHDPAAEAAAQARAAEMKREDNQRE